MQTVVSCLNPYCNGRWSHTLQIYWKFRKNSVLILVVVEDGLVLRRNYNRGLDARHRVLILIVVEDGLVPRVLYS